MYATVARRKGNEARAQETAHAAQQEFMPKLRGAHGVVSLSLVEDREHGVTTEIILWESKAQADAVQHEHERWVGALDAHGHHLESANHGEAWLFTAQR